MTNRNQHRLLNEQQIKNITSQVEYDLKKYTNDSANIFVDHYLRGDVEGLFNVVSSWVEQAEDRIITELNTLLNEDQFKHNDDDYHPSYEL
jgi:pantothenate kinase-related protein Tda10